MHQGQFIEESEVREDIVKKIEKCIEPVLRNSTVDKNEMLSLVPQIDDIVKSAYNFVKDIEQFNDRPQNVPGWVLNGWSGPEEGDHPTNKYSTLPDLHIRERINFLNTEAIQLSEHLEAEDRDIIEEIIRTIQERVRLLELLEIKEHRAHLSNLLLSLYREIKGVLISKVNSPVFQSLKEHHNEIRFSMVFEAFLEDVGDMLLTAAHAWAQTVSGPLEWGLAETGPAPTFTMLPGSDRVWRAAEEGGISKWVPEPNWDPARQDDSDQWEKWEEPGQTKPSESSKEETILRIISPHLEGDFTLGQYTDLLPTVLDLIRNIQNPNTVQLLSVPTVFNFLELSENYSEQGDMNRADKIMAFLDLTQRALFIMDLKQLCLDLLSIIQNEQGNLAEQMVAEGTIQAITPELIKELRKTYDRYNALAYEWANSMITPPVTSPNRGQRVPAPPPIEDEELGYYLDQLEGHLKMPRSSPSSTGSPNSPGYEPDTPQSPPYDPAVAQYSPGYVPYTPHSPPYVPAVAQYSPGYVPYTPHSPPYDPAVDQNVPGYDPFNPGLIPYPPGDAQYIPGYDPYYPGTAPYPPGGAQYIPGDDPYYQDIVSNVPGDVQEIGGGARYSPGVDEEDYNYENFGIVPSSPTPPPSPDASHRSRSRSRSPHRSRTSPKPSPKSKEFVIDFDSDSDSE